MGHMRATAILQVQRSWVKDFGSVDDALYIHHIPLHIASIVQDGELCKCGTSTGDIHIRIRAFEGYTLV